MKRGPRIALVTVALVALAVTLFAATSPHPWFGRLVCEARGGEWTNRVSTRWESIVTSGYRCEGV